MGKPKGTKNKRVRSDKGKKHIKTITLAKQAAQVQHPTQEVQNAERNTSTDAADSSASAAPDTAAE